MKTIRLQEVQADYESQKQLIAEKEATLLQINTKLLEIDETKANIQKWSESIQNTENATKKATFLTAIEDCEKRIAELETEIEELWGSIKADAIPQNSDTSNINDGTKSDEKSVHRGWLNKHLLIYTGFSLVSLVLFCLIHASTSIYNHEWSELLNTVRYTHQIFLKISMGFFGILCMGLSIQLLIPSVLWYYNSKVNTYDFVQDFLNAEPHTRLYVSLGCLYCLMQYWGMIMAWEIVL